MYKLSVEDFHEVQPSQLSLFDLPGYQPAIQSIQYEQVRPSEHFTSNSPILFNISGGGMQYLDLKRSTMYVRMRIVNNDGSYIVYDINHVGPVNLLHSLFSQVDVTIQNKIVTSTTGNYPYNAMIQPLPKYGSDAKKSPLSAQMWISDYPSNLDDPDCECGSNTDQRHIFFKRSKTVDLQGNLYHPLFSMDRYLLNSVNVSVKFYRSEPQFCFMSDDNNADYRIQIEDMYLNVCR